jgi:hypothetical protein
MSQYITPEQKAMLENLFPKEMEKENERQKKTLEFFKNLVPVNPYEGEK